MFSRTHWQIETESLPVHPPSESKAAQISLAFAPGFLFRSRLDLTNQEGSFTLKARETIHDDFLVP